MMLHHTQPFVQATRAELERFLPAPGNRGRGRSSFLERFTGQIRAVARAHRVPAHEVDDVVQTTWLRLLERGDTIREPLALGAWLRTTARRESLSVIRRAARAQPVDPADMLDEHDPMPGPELGVAAAEVAEALAEAIAELPDRQRRLIGVLVAEPAWSYAQVSRALDMPIGSIGPTRERAMARLRQNPRLASIALEQ